MGYKYRHARKVTSLLFNAFTQAVNNNEISYKLDPLFRSSYLLPPLRPRSRSEISQRLGFEIVAKKTKIVNLRILINK